MILGSILAASLQVAALSAGEPVVEPYSSRPTAAEMAFAARWKDFLSKRGDE